MKGEAAYLPTCCYIRLAMTTGSSKIMHAVGSSSKAERRRSSDLTVRCHPIPLWQPEGFALLCEDAVSTLLSCRFVRRRRGKEREGEDNGRVLRAAALLGTATHSNCIPASPAQSTVDAPYCASEGTEALQDAMRWDNVMQETGTATWATAAR